ncbi:hypothetical protein ACIPM2_16915 [Streptomyces sp. NPDC086081]|uniref:hypothetical protein n=1 Tax=Streptomyces sp. NPDC086081 TaxID=3365749 RepID=UPI00380941A4
MAGTTTSGASDTPATALGPTALVLGALSALGTWAFLFPWSVLAGALAVTFGALGMHHARRGAGRMWTSVAGTVLGAAGLVGTVTLLWAMF